MASYPASSQNLSVNPGFTVRAVKVPRAFHGGKIEFINSATRLPRSNDKAVVFKVEPFLLDAGQEVYAFNVNLIRLADESNLPLPFTFQKLGTVPAGFRTNTYSFCIATPDEMNGFRAGVNSFTQQFITDGFRESQDLGGNRAERLWHSGICSRPFMDPHIAHCVEAIMLPNPPRLLRTPAVVPTIENWGWIQ